MDINIEILKLTCDLYNHLKFAKSDIQFIITLVRNFISNIYNPFLLEKLRDTVFKVVSDDVKKEINLIFDQYNDPFDRYSSEDKRLVLYKNLGLYVEPQLHVLENVTTAKSVKNTLFLSSKSIHSVRMPLNHSLTALLEMDGLYDATVSYMNELQSQEHVRSNFIHGSLWKEQIKNFDKSDGIVLPLFVYFDDVETGNALGSHAGKNQIGAVYVTTPCFPPSFASKLESMILVDIFYSKDRKKTSSDVLFEPLIKDLSQLREEGIQIRVRNEIHKVYFIASLILGDNLGLNDILGYVKSFASSRCCRTCYAGPAEIKSLTTEKESLLRTKDAYEKDTAVFARRESGVVKKCVFNNLKDFHVTENISADLMHDVFEGVANCVMTKVLLTLVADKCFSIQYLNYILNTMDFGFEQANVPLDISIDYVKKNDRLKMSASESLFFTRYFGIMVGEIVDEDNDVWKLYIQLRELIDILTSPDMTNLDLLQLPILIQEHHELYIRLFGSLRSKFHALLHYARIIEKNGPVIKFSSMRFESKHREIKAMIQATASRRNVLKTVAGRLKNIILLSQKNICLHPLAVHDSHIIKQTAYAP